MKMACHNSIKLVLRKKGVFAVLILSASGGFASDIAFSQEPEEPAVRILEEVVVTARRRVERLHDVPVSVTALDKEYIRTNTIMQIDDIQYHTPSMHITTNGPDSIEPRVSIRGISPLEARLTDDPSAPIYFSEVVLTPSAGSNLALYDLSAVEVLKGPQGTLFGRNSTAGALLVTPTIPGEQFGGFVDLILGNYGMHKVDFGVDVPVNDSFTLRLAGRHTERDGYQTNKNDLPRYRENYGKKIWNDNTKSVRLSALWNPLEGFKNTTIIEWGKKDALARANKAVLTGRPQFQDSVDRNLALTDPFDVRPSIIAPERVEHTFFANTTTWDTGVATLKNIIGYRKVKSYRMLDLDGMDIAIIESRPGGLGDRLDADQISNEFQFHGSTLDDRLDWLMGLYYYYMDGYTVQDNVNGGGQISEIYNKSKSYAVFGHVDYELRPDWTLSFGVRSSWDRRDIKLRQFGSVLSIPPRGVCGLADPEPDCSISDSESFDALTWNASLSYDYSDSLMIYGAIGTGYKSGGFNSRASTSDALSPFDEETIVNYELGVKGDWAINNWRVRSSTALYYMLYEDIQVSVSECIDLGQGGCSVVANKKNAGKARYQGAEAELTLVTPSGIRLGLTYAYVDPTYKKWDDMDNQGNYVDRADTIFNFQPEHEVGANLSYPIYMASDLGEIVLSANILWRDKMFLTAAPEVIAVPEWRSQVIHDSYHLINLRADWRDVQQTSIDLSLFVKNLENKTYVTSRADQLRDGRGLFWSEAYGEPRTYGVSLRYSF